MNTRVIVLSFVVCATFEAVLPTTSAKIFPMAGQIYASTQGLLSDVGGSPPANGTVDTSIGLGQPQVLVQNLSVPTDVAVSDGILYVVVTGTNMISAFSAADGSVINSNVAPVPQGVPVAIASVNGNVFVANPTTNTINEYSSSGGAPVASFSADVRNPTEITASGSNLFVVNSGSAAGHVAQYITQYDAATGQKIGDEIIQGLPGSVQITVLGTDLFIANISTKTIDLLNLTTHQLTSGFITGLIGPTDIASFAGGLFVTDVPNQSVDVYDAETGSLFTTITGFHGQPVGIDVVAAPAVPDQSATWLLLLLGLTAILSSKLIIRQVT